MNTGKTHWIKGQSGNPNGRPKDTLGNFLREKKGLPEDIFNAVEPLLKSQDESIRMKAAEFLRDTRDGRPGQSVALTDADGQPLQLQVVSYSECQK